MLFSEPKIPQFERARLRTTGIRKVSVLFSEPKIPQCGFLSHIHPLTGVSVLFSEPKIPQFIEMLAGLVVQFEFQCSSASRKFLNLRIVRRRRVCDPLFQCSSASRKFLNLNNELTAPVVARRFSALQRAENSSIWHTLELLPGFLRFSALQRAENSSIERNNRYNSVRRGFSALQRAENSSIVAQKDF